MSRELRSHGTVYSAAIPGGFNIAGNGKSIESAALRPIALSWRSPKEAYGRKLSR